MTQFRTVPVDGLDIFYREAGSPEHPTILLLHGFPTSSHMFRNLIPALADQFHLIAPDYPGFGNSSMPSVDEFDYTFDHLAEIMGRFVDELGLTRYSLYLMDYGAPIAYRMAVAHPERVEALIIQNGNAYDEGLREFWDPIKTYWQDRSAQNEPPIRFLFSPEGVRWQYLNGVRSAESVSPDNWNMDQPLLERPGNDLIQLQLMYSYGSNPPHYPEWQQYFRTHQPPALIVWGRNDFIFPPDGAHPYLRDLLDVDLNLLDTGHFALEEDLDVIAGHVRRFLGSRVRGVAAA